MRILLVGGWSTLALAPSLPLPAFLNGIFPLSFSLSLSPSLRHSFGAVLLLAGEGRGLGLKEGREARYRLSLCLFTPTGGGGRGKEVEGREGRGEEGCLCFNHLESSLICCTHTHKQRHTHTHSLSNISPSFSLSHSRACTHLAILARGKSTIENRQAHLYLDSIL